MNYLLGQVYDLGSIYMEMYQISRNSFRRYLRGEYEELFLHEDYPKPLEMDGYRAMYRHSFAEIRRLVESGNNVLVCCCDTFCQRPTEIFGRYEQMMMFWKTSGPDYRERPQLNGGVMYFPASMDLELFQPAEERIAKLGNDWGEIQEIYNDMFWAQSPVPELNPAMNWCPLVKNPLDESEANIIHFHASRDSQKTRETMKERSRTCASLSLEPVS